MHSRLSLRSPRLLAVSCLAGLALALLTAGSASAHRYAGGCDEGALCLFDHADYNKGLSPTEDRSHSFRHYSVSGDITRPSNDDLRGSHIYNRASSWINNTSAQWCAFDGKTVLWTMNRHRSSRWVGTVANDRIDRVGPCPAPRKANPGGPAGSGTFPDRRA